jgi:hypothetical protein
MQKALLASLLVVTFLGVRGGNVQQPAEPGEAVWSLDFVKVKPGMFEQTMNYLDDGWIPAREEAKQQGVIIGYRRIAEMSEAKSEWDIILMTEYKNQAAYDERDKTLGPIVADVWRNNQRKTDGLNKKDLYTIVDTRVLRDFSTVENPHLKLIGKL